MLRAVSRAAFREATLIERRGSLKRRRTFIRCCAAALAAALMLSSAPDSKAQFRSRYSNLPAAGFGGRGVTRSAPVSSGRRSLRGRVSGGPAGVYPEFRHSQGVVRWIKEQMPLKIWVSNGLALDAIMNPQLGAPYANVDNTAGWPDLVAGILSNPKQLAALPPAKGFRPEQRQATIEGINFWKPFEKEHLFSFQFTDDPGAADIHVFYVNHFVNKLGLALFSSDIRGYTAKRIFPYKAVMQGRKADFKPVVIILRTTDKHGRSMDVPRMRAAAGHEFGHALGIDGHSKNAADLMSVYYGNGRISRNDAATIRYLYKLTPDLIP